MAKNNNGLTLQQQGFCDDLRKDPTTSATQAYLNNYKAKSEKVAGVCAAKLLGNARVVSYLERKQKEIEKKVDFEHEAWMRYQVKVLKISMAEESTTKITSVIENGKAKEIEYREQGFNANGANKALDNIARMKGYYSDKKPVDPNKIRKTHNNWIIMPVRSLHPDAQPIDEGLRQIIDGKYDASE